MAVDHRPPSPIRLRVRSLVLHGRATEPGRLVRGGLGDRRSDWGVAQSLVPRSRRAVSRFSRARGDERHGCPDGDVARHTRSWCAARGGGPGPQEGRSPRDGSRRHAIFRARCLCRVRNSPPHPRERLDAERSHRSLIRIVQAPGLDPGRDSREPWRRDLVSVRIQHPGSLHSAVGTPSWIQSAHRHARYTAGRCDLFGPQRAYHLGRIDEDVHSAR